MATSQTTAATDVSRIQQLAREHATIENQLQLLQSKHPFSFHDEMEATRLKKLKLHLKDAMRSLET